MAYGIPPLGCALFGGNASSRLGNDVIGGSFIERYNGASLSSGTHIIIEDRTCKVDGGSAALCIFHPWGSDTLLSVALPATWQQSAVSVVALNSTLSVLSTVPSAASGAFVTFFWRNQSNGSSAVVYAVLPTFASASPASSGSQSPSSSSSGTQSPSSAVLSVTLSPTASFTSSKTSSIPLSPSEAASYRPPAFSATGSSSWVPMTSSAPNASSTATSQLPSTTFSASESATALAPSAASVAADASDSLPTAAFVASVSAAAVVAAVVIAIATVVVCRRSHRATPITTAAVIHRMPAETAPAILSPRQSVSAVHGVPPELLAEGAPAYLSTPIVKARSTARSYRQLSFDAAQARGPG